MKDLIAKNVRIALAGLAGSAWCLAVLDHVFAFQLSSRLPRLQLPEVQTPLVTSVAVFALGGAVLGAIFGRAIETEFEPKPVSTICADLFFFACLIASLVIIAPVIHSESGAHIVPGVFIFEDLTWAIFVIAILHGGSFWMSYRKRLKTANRRRDLDFERTVKP